MIVLLTGPPGVGKTTVAQRIASLYPRTVKTVGFGRLVYEVVTSRSPLPYQQFRSVAAEVTTAADLSAAAAKLVSLVTATRAEGGWLLVESHAVARETFGWQAHPDPPSVLESYAYDTLVHLDAPAHVILRRSRADDGGRLAQDERDVAVLATIQMAVSVYYAAVLGVPLNVIDAGGPAEEVVASVCSLLGLSEE
jgi:adenylate kinase